MTTTMSPLRLRAEQENLLTAVLVHRPEVLNGQLAGVRPQDFAGDLPRAIAQEAIDQIEAGTHSPRLITAAVSDQGSWSPGELQEYLNHIEADWCVSPDAFLRSAATEAIRSMAEDRATVQLAKTLDRCTARLAQSGPTATASDVLPDLDQALSEARYSIRALSVYPLRETKLVVASELGPAEDPPWIKTGYLARGSVTLLIAPAKLGKTTWYTHMVADTCSGGQATIKAIIVSEESASLWTQRRDDLGITDDVAFILRPFKAKPTTEQWRELIGKLEKAVLDDGYSMVVIDPWAAVSPVQDENDAAKTIDALLPLHRLTEAGAAVMLVHHSRKSEGNEGHAARGSGALTGFVDIIVELRRFDPLRTSDPKRILKVFSRFDTPPETVIELGADGYFEVGTRNDAVRAERIETIENMMTDDGITVGGILASWPEDGPRKPGRRTLDDDLTLGYRKGSFNRTGKGVRGNPFLFSQPIYTGTRETNTDAAEVLK